MYQTETSECGLACLAIALERLGSSADLFSLRQKYGISTRGMTLREVRDIASDLGMLGRAIRCEVDELKNLKTPAILHWGLNHFVVLERADKRGVTITDPAAGKSRYKMDEVSRKFTGVAMELTATQAFVKRKPVSPLSLGSWYTWSRELTTPLIHLLVMSLLLQLFVLATPFYIQLAIDQAALRGDLKLLGVLALGFGALAIFSAVASLLRELVTIRLTSLLSWQMTLRLFRHLIRLPLPWYQRRKLADILSRFDAIIPVRELLTGALIAVVIDGLLALGTLVMMFVFAPPLAWIVVCGFVLFVAIKLSALPLSMRLGMDAITARIGEHGKRIESIRAIQTVKVMGAETERENDWANKFANTIRADQKKSIATVSFLALNGCVDGVLRVVLIYAGARAVMDGSMSIGLFYAFLTYHGQFTARSSALLDQVVNWRLTDLYSFRLADIVLSNKEAGVDDPALRREDVSGALEFKNLSFAYAPREPNVFSNLSFSIAAGEFVAVVGPSGCGKSTLLKVLCGLYPATHGDILIDGRALSSLGPKAFRSVLGVVMQDDELMSGTIAENVCFFDEKMDLDWVRECLRMAALLDEVRRMPMGVDTMIGDMGASLSGGQKQRLLLARALYRRPRILVLDEATSHLDKLKEVEINKALRALDITRIVVAHRQETIAAADRVIRLEQGRVSVVKMAAGVA